MMALRALLSKDRGEAPEGNGTLWAAEALGLVEVTRYLPEGRVFWIRTQAGARLVGAA